MAKTEVIETRDIPAGCDDTGEPRTEPAFKLRDDVFKALVEGLIREYWHCFEQEVDLGNGQLDLETFLRGQLNSTAFMGTAAWTDFIDTMSTAVDEMRSSIQTDPSNRKKAQDIGNDWPEILAIAEKHISRRCYEACGGEYDAEGKVTDSAMYDGIRSHVCDDLDPAEAVMVAEWRRVFNPMIRDMEGREFIGSDVVDIADDRQLGGGIGV
jgi:hypothetical protein